MSMAEFAHIAGRLPNGPEFAAAISLDIIALRVGDRTCLAAPRWLDASQAQDVAAALLSVSDA